VDDSDTNLTKAKESFGREYRVMPLPSAARMFALLEKVTPDLILLDITMPEMDGFEALTLLKANKNYADIPVIFLTAQTEHDIEARGFDLGAVDFITKPFSARVLRNRVQLHLDIDGIIRERTARLVRMQNALVKVIADMVEVRDEITGGHIERTSSYIQILMETMIQRGLYAEEMRGWDVELAVLSARLHDVGKMAISDSILNKPGKLTDEEFEIMKTHALEGEKIMDKVIAENGEDALFLNNAKLFAGYHHEKWNGAGYPRGVAGTSIPLQGRIMAIADVYDALVSERPYKKAFPVCEAERIIMSESEKHFDPKITAVFSDVKEQFRAVRDNL
jgi:putative two-component system response regulator